MEDASGHDGHALTRMSCTKGFLNHVTGLCNLCLRRFNLGALDCMYLQETALRVATWKPSIGTSVKGEMGEGF